tara:strand:+ start:10529 stop:11317 length:789 start_codon:yes stop_codon:yes gene_type:complete
MTSLTNKCALITGSSSGLGLAIAESLAERGCRIMLHGRSAAETMSETCNRLTAQYGVAIDYHQADISSLAGITDLVAAARQSMGSIDILINNAVTRHFAPVHEIPDDAWQQALAVNLSAPLRAIKQVIPGMREKNWGRIFNMTSIYGVRGTPNRVDYVTCKSGLLGLTRVVALENLDYGITCNAISPGSTLTPNIAGRVATLAEQEGLEYDEAVRRFLQGKQPSGRFNQSEHVGELIAFLCSDAGSDMTGIMLPVDGGWLAS